MSGKVTEEQPMDTDDGMQNSYYKIQEEVAVSLQKKCILHISGQRSKQTVALGLSDFSLAVYDVNTWKNIHNFSSHTNTITDVKFGTRNENLLYSSSLDGYIKVHDLRSNKFAFQVQDDSEGLAKLKPITSFDFSCDEVFAAAGTEVYNGDAYIVFYDIRQQRLLGGYWETHDDDVTQVRFHPKARSILTTGSTDGLINVFDINDESEDDALRYSLNTESSVDQLFWIEGRNYKYHLSCITHTEEIQLWECEGASPFAHFSRKDIANYIQDGTARNTYIVNTLTQTEDDLLMMTGCNTKERNALQILYLNKDNMNKVHRVSHLKGNKQRVRSSLCYKEDEILLTGGENGILNLWKPCSIEDIEEVMASDSSQLKEKVLEESASLSDISDLDISAYDDASLLSLDDVSEEESDG